MPPMNDGEWFDLSLTRPIGRYSINSIVTLDESGSGKAILLSFLGVPPPLGGPQSVDHYLLDPEQAGQLGYALMGSVHGYESYEGDDPIDDDEEDEDFE